MPATIGSSLTTAFVIRELTGSQRQLTLRERALPYRPFELSGTQRNTIDWYPGSPIGVAQVYGAREEPTTINGAWKDKFLTAVGPEPTPAEISVTGDRPDLGFDFDILQTARDLVRVVDDIRRQGQEIEVTWLDQVRRGILERFTVRWQTGHDCEWEMSFSWLSQGEDLNTVALVDPGTDIGDIPNKVQAYLDTINTENIAELVPQAGSRFSDVVDELADIGANIQDFTDNLTDTVVALSWDATAHNLALQRTAGILDGIKLEADLLSEIAEETADGIALDSGALSSINTTLRSFGQILLTRAKIRERSTAATELRNLAAREQAVLLRKILPNVIAVFQAREGQDLRTVSQTYYGTPDEWRSLMVHNRLSSSALVAGQVIFVPASPQKGRLC